MSSRGVVAAAVPLASLALLAAGCGGGSKSPSVASLGGTTTTSNAASGAPTSSGSSRSVVARFVAFVHCMQKHGVPAQIGSGGHSVSISAGPGLNQTQLEKAQLACRNLLPGGVPKALTPAQQAQQIKLLVTLASCMRKHGYPSFPDPDSQGSFNFTQTSGIDPGSPQFQQAMNACRPGNGRIPLRIAFRSPVPPGGGGKVSTPATLTPSSAP